MKGYRNPFDVLGASPSDSRQKLASLAADAALLGDEAEAQKAHADLLNADARLAAELRWTIGDTELSAFNRLFCAFEKDIRRMDAGQAVQRLCAALGMANAQTIADGINRARGEAGILPAAETAVQEALGAYMREAAKTIADALRSVEKLGNAILMCAGEWANNGLLLSLLETYELRAAEAMETERQKISTQVAKYRWGVKMDVRRDTDRLCKHLMRWNELDLPVRRANAARGLPHKLARDCCFEVMQVYPLICALGVKQSFQLADTLKRCFGDVEECKESIDKHWEKSREVYEIARKNTQKNHKELVVGTVVFVVCLLIALQAPTEDRWKVGVGIVCMALAWLLHRWTKKSLK